MALNYDDLTDVQKKAFDLAVDPPKHDVRIAGYAGTGKTTVMAAIAQELGADCAVLAPTNKAANNLRDKGIRKTKTVHSFLYQPQEVEIFRRDKDDEIVYLRDDAGEILRDENNEPVPEVVKRELQFSLKDAGENDFPRYCLVDESSMIKRDMMEDLLMAFEHVIFFGDMFQLPPVAFKKEDKVSALDIKEPDIFLTEVHRQALENPIIRYATAIREGNEPRLEDIACDEIRVLDRRNKEEQQAILQWVVDNNAQAISFRNKTRHNLNNAIRVKQGKPKYGLVPGDALICCQNIYERKEIGGEKVRVLQYYNGQLEVSDSAYDSFDREYWFNPLPVNLQGQTSNSKMFPFWSEKFFDLFDNNRALYDAEQRYYARNGRRPFGHKWDFAYCLTAHKAQGSEFENVAIFDERPTMNKSSHEERQKWFYTAVTRAKEKILVVRGY